MRFKLLIPLLLLYFTVPLLPTAFARRRECRPSDVAWSPDSTQSTATGIFTIAVSPNESLIAGGGVNLLCIWDLNGSLLHAFENISENIFAVVWSPDGTKVATGGSGQSVKVWNVSDPQFIVGHLIATYDRLETPIQSLGWSPDGFKIVGVTREGSNTLFVWDAINFIPSPIQQERVSNLLEIAWSPNGDQIAIASEVGILLFDADFDVNINDLAVYISGPFIVTPTVAWSPDGLMIVAGDILGRIHVIDPVTGETIQTYQIHDSGITASVWQPTSSSTIATSNLDTIKIWDTDSGEIIQIITIDTQTRILTMEWSSDGCNLFHGNSRGNLSIIAVQSDQCPSLDS